MSKDYSYYTYVCTAFSPEGYCIAADGTYFLKSCYDIKVGDTVVTEVDRPTGFYRSITVNGVVVTEKHSQWL
jgi:hypothetical protein